MNINLTEAEKEMLKRAKEQPVVPDEDCPEATDEQLRKAVEERRKRRGIA